MLSPGEAIPFNVGAVITTEEEAERIDFDRSKMVIAKKPQSALDIALRLVRGDRDYSHIVIGIDPGKYPGLAVLGNGKAIEVHHLSVGEVRGAVENIMRRHPGMEVTVRVGHGARLSRMQIVNSIADIAHVELVDETDTTPVLGRGVRGEVVSDIIAAINIAGVPGVPAGRQVIEPSDGEVRVIQEHSRSHTNGRATISRRLARRVAKGELTLDEAVSRYKS